MAFTFILMRRAADIRSVRRLALGLTLLLGLPSWAQAACQGTVYLTFDTGNMSQAETIARILNAHAVRATFFLANEKTYRGDHALDPSWQAYWRARVAEGHSFGNHTWDHVYLKRDLNERETLAAGDNGEQRLTADGLCRELNRVDERFQELTGARLAGLWRAPGGRTTRQTIRWAASCGYPLHVHWNDAGFIGDELPSDTYPNDALLERALKNIRPGTVVMMHLGIWSRKQPLAPILDPLITGLKARGYCFAPLAVAGRGG